MKFREISKEQIKTIKSLHKKSGRDKHHLFIAEGYKICKEVLNSEYEVDFVVLPGNAGEKSKELSLEIGLNRRAQIYKVNHKIFDSLCDTDTPQDILTCLRIHDRSPDKEKSFIALDSVSDPGNVGTIIRTAKWFGFEQVILNDGCADIFNPKTIRSSMGAILKVSCFRTNNLKSYIRENFPGHHIIGTFLDGDIELSEIKLSEKIGIIFGNESTGISDEMIPIIDERVNIYGSGDFDSLNVSVSAGIVLYELSVKK